MIGVGLRYPNPTYLLQPSGQALALEEVPGCKHLQIVERLAHDCAEITGVPG